MDSRMVSGSVSSRPVSSQELAQASSSITELSADILEGVYQLADRLAHVNKRLHEVPTPKAEGIAQSYGSGVLANLQRTRDVLLGCHALVTDIDLLVGSSSAKLPS